MTSKRVLAGLGGLGGLGLLAFIGALAHWWWLVVLAIAAMLGLLGVIALNTNTLVRSHRTAWDRSVRTGGASAPLLTSGVVSAPATEKDLTGALRLLQAQYVGRLDRAQTTLERAAAKLDAAGAGPGPATPDAWSTLPAGASLVLHEVTDETLAAARRAADAGVPVRVIDPDSRDRERLEAAGLGEVDILDAVPHATASIVLPESPAAG
ncbi:hypothetical protein [Nostocoides jenkinsii]|uniref:Uncharacterized protein n=1 Tax=Nostocoides jenkinsii Ben 74 TaxID=1193518 RepID=A0A077MGJ9_9MICO|nr:hypothetical protein [Tetrasphaera jenkinsii]CCI54878.1 exported hypothetical protein [Tetrasphaera jenkinsii Ben 74]